MARTRAEPHAPIARGDEVAASLRQYLPGPERAAMRIRLELRR
jgi:hypothetical protein